MVHAGLMTVVGTKVRTEMRRRASPGSRQQAPESDCARSEDGVVWIEGAAAPGGAP